MDRLIRRSLRQGIVKEIRKELGNADTVARAVEASRKGGERSDGGGGAANNPGNFAQHRERAAAAGRKRWSAQPHHPQRGTVTHGRSKDMLAPPDKLADQLRNPLGDVPNQRDRITGGNAERSPPGQAGRRKPRSAAVAHATTITAGTIDLA